MRIEKTIVNTKSTPADFTEKDYRKKFPLKCLCSNSASTSPKRFKAQRDARILFTWCRNKDLTSLTTRVTSEAVATTTTGKLVPFPSPDMGHARSSMNSASERHTRASGWPVSRFRARWSTDVRKRAHGAQEEAENTRIGYDVTQDSVVM